MGGQGCLWRGIPPGPLPREASGAATAGPRLRRRRGRLHRCYRSPASRGACPMRPHVATARGRGQGLACAQPVDRRAPAADCLLPSAGSRQGMPPRPPPPHQARFLPWVASRGEATSLQGAAARGCSAFLPPQAPPPPEAARSAAAGGRRPHRLSCCRVTAGQPPRKAGAWALLCRRDRRHMEDVKIEDGKFGGLFLHIVMPRGATSRGMDLSGTT